MIRPRDNQRSRVYDWEGRVPDYDVSPSFKTIDECAQFLTPIWRAERGRYGRAKVPSPLVQRPHRGQTAALAYADHRITLPRWARRPSTILHEAAHRLTPRDEAHGPRFVGVLIGLMSRHMGADAYQLMALADEMGVRYHVRSIGTVPVIGTAEHVRRAVVEQGPMSEMDIACWLDLSYLQVRGAAMSLIRRGVGRWYRRKLVIIVAPAPVAVPAAPRAPTVRDLAKRHGVEIDREGGGWSVWPPANLCDVEDPFEGDHYHGTWDEVKDAVVRYLGLLGIQVPGYGEWFAQPSGAVA